MKKINDLLKRQNINLAAIDAKEIEAARRIAKAIADTFKVGAA